MQSIGDHLEWNPMFKEKIIQKFAHNLVIYKIPVWLNVSLIGFYRYLILFKKSKTLS